MNQTPSAFKQGWNAFLGSFIAFAFVALVSCGTSTMVATSNSERVVEASQAEFKREFSAKVSETIREQNRQVNEKIRDIHSGVDTTNSLIRQMLEMQGYVVLPSGDVIPPKSSRREVGTITNTVTNTDNSHRTTYTQNINTHVERVTKEEGRQ